MRYFQAGNELKERMKMSESADSEFGRSLSG